MILSRETPPKERYVPTPLTEKACGSVGDSWQTVAENLCEVSRSLERTTLEQAKRIEELEGALRYVRGLGEVYVYPSDWRCAKEGGYPPIEAYEKIDLSSVGESALNPATP